MRWTRWVLPAAGALALLPAPARAQQATPTATPAAASAPVSVGASAAENQKVIEAIKRGEEQVLTGKGGVEYNPAGRRDPFVDPLSKGEGPDDPKSRPEGWPGMLIGEVQLQGLTVFGGEPIAIFRGTDSIGYFAREGDELWDGKIVSINFDTDEKTVVFQQKVEDPSSPIRFRDVVKKLHP